MSVYVYTHRHTLRSLFDVIQHELYKSFPFENARHFELVERCGCDFEDVFLEVIECPFSDGINQDWFDDVLTTSDIVKFRYRS